MAYLDYASCYVVGHNVVYNHHLKPAAIVLWVLVAIFQASVLFYWFLIFVNGPGRAPQIRPLDIYGTDPSLPRVPPVFLCDEQGFPIWCSKCQTIKQQRLFHLGDLDYCVSKFDHFCLWVGTAIGRNNLLHFFRFVLFFDAYFIVILCYVAATTRLAIRSSENLPHYIILYIFCFFWITMTLALFGILLNQLGHNRTTLDEIFVKQARSYSRWEKSRNRRSGNSFLVGKTPREERGIRYVNVAHEGTRKVVPYHVQDKPYDFGFQCNFIDFIFRGNRADTSTVETATTRKFLKALAVFALPYSEFFIRGPTPNDQEKGDELSDGDDFSPKFLDDINDKIAKGSFTYASYLQQTSHATKISQSPET